MRGGGGRNRVHLIALMLLRLVLSDVESCRWPASPEREINSLGWMTRRPRAHVRLKCS